MKTKQMIELLKQEIDRLDKKSLLTGEDLAKHNELCKAYNLLTK